MLTYLLLVILLYYVQVFLPAAFKLLQVGLPAYIGSRDNEPASTGVAARMERATNNMRENFPPFAALAVALLATAQADSSQAILGAQIFLICRAIYVPLYAAAVPLIRSLMALGGWIGMTLMALPLISLIGA